MIEEKSLVEVRAIFEDYVKGLSQELVGFVMAAFDELVRRGGRPYLNTWQEARAGVTIDGADLSVAKCSPLYKEIHNIDTRLRMATREEALAIYAFGDKQLVEMMGHTSRGNLSYRVNFLLNIFEVGTLGDRREQMSIPTVPADAIEALLRG